MRTRQEASGAVVRPELVHHKDESDQGPAAIVAREIDMKVLGGEVRPQCPRVHRAELEGFMDDALA